MPAGRRARAAPPGDAPAHAGAPVEDGQNEAPGLGVRLREGLARVKSSRFARDSAMLLMMNLLSRAVSFVASAYALRCLGPYNVGVSGLIQVTSQQVSLGYHGGFDTPAVRRIAADCARAGDITRTVVGFRGVLSLLAALVWVLVVLAAPEMTHRSAWLWGAPLLLISAGNVGFVFNAVERLPVQTAIGTGGTLLAAAAYLLLFRPGMPLGSDLAVMVGVGVLTTVFSWVAYRRMFGEWPVGGAAPGRLGPLLRESWRFWALAVAVFLYSTFQIPLIAHYLGAHQTGLYRSAFTMAAAVELLYNSINSLLLPRLVKWRSAGAGVLWRRQGQLFAVFSAIGAAVTLVLAAAAPTIFALALGPAFVPAVPVFQVLLVGRLVVFLGQIYTFGLAAAGLDNSFLGVSVLGAVLSITLNVLLLPHFGLYGAAAVSVGVELVISLFSYFALRRHVRAALAGA
jgi:O-antigen/teichoic acid export membrane protein